MLAGPTGAATCAREGTGGALARATSDHPRDPPPTAGGDGPGAEEQTAVAIASVQQAAFGDHNIQYQFRTENNGGQVRLRARSPAGKWRVESRAGGLAGWEGLGPGPCPGPSAGLAALPPPAGDVPRSPGD